MRRVDLLPTAPWAHLPPRPRRPARAPWQVLIVTAGTLAIACVLAAILESPAIGIEDASPVFLLPVVAVGTVGGTWSAIATAVGAFVVYDLLFTQPRMSVTVDDPREWLDLLLFLLVALGVGRLVALQHARAEEAARRASEAHSLFAIARELAVATSTNEAAADVATRLRTDVGLDRVTILIGTSGSERVAADTAPGMAMPEPSIVTTLVRRPGDEPARWVRTHAGGASSGVGAGGADPGTPPGGPGAPSDVYRVRIEADGDGLGAIVALRARGSDPPAAEGTRLLALAADQLGLSLRRDQLRQAGLDLEVARQTDALKTALIDSVSHDLRTPLASIRATAGGLADPAVPWTDAARRTAAARIDAEAARLDRLVSGLLDLGRIASGAIHPDLEPHEPWSIVEPAIDRLRPAFGDRPLQIDVPDDLPPVLADAALLDIVITNLLDNVVRHVPAPAPVAVHGRLVDRERVVALVVEDGGAGVPLAALPRLFDRFERAGRATTTSRRGLGIGLSVVKGLVEAMGGTVTASASPLGGLAITVTLRVAEPPLSAGG